MADSAPSANAVIEQRAQSREQYQDLLARAQEMYADDPARLRRYVSRLIWTANLYVIGLLLLCLLILLSPLILYLTGLRAPGTGYLLFLAAVMTWSLGRALWIRNVPPTGVELLPTEGRQVWDMVREIVAESGAPMPDRIFIDLEFNAGATEFPRGFFGLWSERILTIGLPLTMVLTSAQGRALIEHEFAHLIGRDARFHRRVARAFEVWRRLVAGREIRSRLESLALNDFANWFYPRIAAAYGVLERGTEYEADRHAAPMLLLVRSPRDDRNGELAQALVNQTRMFDIPTQPKLCYIMSPSPAKAWRKRLDNVAGALVYRR